MGYKTPEYKKFFKKNPDCALKRYAKKIPWNNVEEYCFLLLKELEKAMYSKLPHSWDSMTAEMQNDFLENWIDKLNDIY